MSSWNHKLLITPVLNCCIVPTGVCLSVRRAVLPYSIPILCAARDFNFTSTAF